MEKGTRRRIFTLEAQTIKIHNLLSYESARYFFIEIAAFIFKCVIASKTASLNFDLHGGFTSGMI